MKPFIQLILSITFVVTANSLFAKEITIIDPYIREVPPGQDISASFMTLKNDSNKAISLIEICGDIAKSIELHQHTHNDGIMEMRQVEKIIIPANGSIILKPGGYHIMLIGLSKKIKSGDKIKLTLAFDDHSKQTILVDVINHMQSIKKHK